MPRAISPGPAGLKFWRAPGLSADNTDDTGSLPAGLADTFYPWGRKRPVQDWAWGNLCLYPPSEPGDTTNLPAGAVNWFNPWGAKRPVQDWFRGPIPAVPVIFPAGSGSYTLTGGAAVTFAFGQVAAASAYTLTGAAATLVLGHVAGTGSYTLTGSNAGLALGLGAGAGSYTLTGTAAGLVMPFTLTAAAGSYTLTGAAAAFLIPAGVSYLPAGMTGGFNPWSRRPFNLTIADRGPLTAAVGGDQTISAGGGNYTFTGLNADLTVGDTGQLPAGAVSWFNPWRRPYPTALLTRTGRPLAVGPLTLTAGAGSYTITGSSAALALRLTANSGSYTVSGSAAVLARGFAAGAGAYAILGTDADLRVAGSITLACGAGSYTITGSDVSFVGVTPPVEVTPPPVGGTPAGFRVGRYRQFKLKKKRKHDQCEELLEYLRSLPPAEAEAAVAELPSRYLSLLDGLPLPHALVLPPHPSRSPQDDEDDDDACALLLEMLLR